MTDNAIETKALTKVFNGLKAVDHLTLTVDQGEIFGFLGPNGAGKTTTIKMMLGLTRPTSGDVLIDGLSVEAHELEVKARVGYLPERVAFYPNLTAMQTLRFFAELRGGDKAQCKTLIEEVGLGAFADVRVGTFSRGMVQLLGVAQALLGSPKVLILDEPTAGLDPRWTRTVKDRMLASSENGITVFFSSHLLSEVHEIAGRVAILNRGKLVVEDTVEALEKRVAPRPKMRVKLNVDASEAARVLQGLEGVAEVEAKGNELIIVCDENAKARVIQQLMERKFEVAGILTEEASLEEVFLALTEDTKGAVR